jgi:hypothetical protein
MNRRTSVPCYADQARDRGLPPIHDSSLDAIVAALDEEIIKPAEGGSMNSWLGRARR